MAKLQPSSTQSTTAEVDPAFATHYLQRATTELAEDLEKLRGASDFNAETSVAHLVEALQQGATQFSPRDQGRVIDELKGGKTEE